MKGVLGYGPNQASTSVRHLALPCHWSQRSIVAADLVRCYGALGRSIIFCETKRDCNDLAASLGEAMHARALHGDIPQQQREVRNPSFEPYKRKYTLGRKYTLVRVHCAVPGSRLGAKWGAQSCVHCAGVCPSRVGRSICVAGGAPVARQHRLCCAAPGRCGSCGQYVRHSLLPLH